MPGDEEEKISPLMRPIIDNLEQLIDSNEEERYKDEKELQGKTDEARSGMEKAYRIVAELSNAPDYGVGTMKFIYLEHRIQVIDSFGETAAEGAEMILDRFGDDEMKQIWEEIRSNG